MTIAGNSERIRDFLEPADGGEPSHLSGPILLGFFSVAYWQAC